MRVVLTLVVYKANGHMSVKMDTHLTLWCMLLSFFSLFFFLFFSSIFLFSLSMPPSIDQTTVATLSPFLRLPDELQIRILSHLPSQELLKATAVCQKWKRLALDGTLWTKIDVTPFYSAIPSEQLLRLGVAAGKFLRVANFRGCVQLTGHGLRTLAGHCPNVQELHLKDCRGLSTHSIACFLQSAKQLRVLDLSGLDTVKDSTLMVVGRLSHLEKLNIGWCRNLTGQGVQAIARGCPELTCLKLNGCPQLNDVTMDILGKHLTRLSHLCLASCTGLSDGALLAFLRHQLPLSHLNLSSCARLSDASLRHIAIHCSKLTHLELAGCVLLTDQGFCYLAPRLRTLTHLDLEDLQQITGITVKSLANHQPNLRRLCLSNCTQIADDAITHLVLHGVCHQLQHLELDNCIVTDEALDTIAMFLTQPPSPNSNREDSSFTFFSSSPPASATATPASTTAENDPDPKEEKRRKLSVEVLDCSNITETGVRSALAKASPMLTIKSFYSWRDEDDHGQEDGDEESEVMSLNLRGRARLRRNATTARGRYNTIAYHRRRPDNAAGAAGQPYAANCIIL
ncbi:hypothetical protein BJV82DRAFT_586010 [Fennellomyces sp. T-0311]|nr:hypothetical protein BJV82DRAFT_586010 [Fennellomyces sp. T-0311]